MFETSPSCEHVVLNSEKISQMSRNLLNIDKAPDLV
jgi:hypothetical protein